MAKRKPDLGTMTGEVRRFRCKHTCYWNGTLWIGEDKVREFGRGEVSTIEFRYPATIPPDFQFDNWEEY